MSKVNSLYIIFRFALFLFSLFYLHSDFLPILVSIKKEGLNVNVITYIKEMYDNLTIYREKYTKDTKDVEKVRWFKNGDIYAGSFYRGNFNQVHIIKVNKIN